MPYFKILAPYGHHGSGYKNHMGGWIYSRGKDLLDACRIVANTPGVRHDNFIPYNTNKIDEKDYVINSVIVCQRAHYNREAYFRQIHQMKSVVCAILQEHKDFDYEMCDEAKKLINYYNTYNEAKQEENQEGMKKISNNYFEWIKENYYNQASEDLYKEFKR